MYRIALTVLSLSFMLITASNAEDNIFKFKFEHLTNSRSLETLENLTGENFAEQKNLMSLKSLHFSQYDASWTYLIDKQKFNVDLGVTLRHLSGKNFSDSNRMEAYSFDETLPLLHAAALFNLPYKGLSAGVESSHLNYDDNLIFDYRAKLSYEWRDGFGLQGGWQHQQFNIEHNESNITEYESRGPFIDLYLHF